MAEVHAARGHDHLAEPLARRVHDDAGSQEQFTAERRRAALVLATEHAVRGDLAGAGPLLDDAAELLRAAAPSTFGPESVWRRMAGRTAEAYRVRGVEEPPSMLIVRRANSIPAEAGE